MRLGRAAEATGRRAALGRFLDMVSPSTVPDVPRFWRYAVAPATTLACCLIQLAVVPEHGIAPYVFFYVAVVASAWVGGRGPGILAAALSAMTGNYVFMAPHRAWSLSGPALAATALFCIASLLIALVCAAFRDAMLRAEKSAQALRASETRLRLAQEAAQIGSFEWNLQTGVDTWSPELEAMHGLSPGGFARTHSAWEHFVHPDDRAQATRLVQDALDTGLPKEGDWRVIRPDGSVRWVAARFQAFRDPTGTLLRLTGVNLDITERRRTERRLRSFYEAGVVGVFYWTHDGRITDANDKFLQTLGCTRQDLEAGQVNWEQMTAPEFRHLDERALRDLNTTGHTQPFEKEYIRKDGARVRVIVGEAMIDDSRHEGVGFTVDVTDRKRTEAVLKDNAELLKLSQDAIFVWRFSGGIETWNRGAEVQYGFTTDEARGCVPFDLLRTRLPVTREQFGAELKRSRQWEGELVHTTKDGRHVCVWARMQVVRNDDGVERVLESSRDITERKATESRLAYLASFPEKSPNPIVEADLDGNVRYANPTALRTLPGIREAGVTHPWLSDWMQVANKVRVEGGGSRVVVSAGRTYHQELTYLSADDTIRAYGLDITERADAEEALRRSEQRWNAALEHLEEAVVVATGNGEVFYWNPAARAMHGLTGPDQGHAHLEEFRDTYELRTTDGGRLLPIEEWPMPRVMRGETVRNLELRLRRPDQGWERIVSYSGLMAETAGGERLVFLSIHDLTLQRKAEADLRESELRYRTVGETIPYGVWTADAKGNCTYVSQSFLDMIGTSLEEVQRFGWGRLLPPEDAEPAKAHWLRCVARGESFEREYRFGDKDGSSKYVLAIGRPVIEDGSVTSWVGVNLDITDRKRAEEAVRRSREMLAEAEALSHTGAWEWDRATDQWTFSDEWLAIHGCRQRSLSPEEQLAIAHPDDRADVARALKNVRDGIAPYDLEHRIVRQDNGEVRVVHARGRLVRDSGDNVIKVYGFAQDITERKRAEQDVLGSREGLRRLAQTSLEVMANTDLGAMLQTISEAALTLTGARLATCGHGYVGGQYVVGGAARVPGAPACPPGEMFKFGKGGVHTVLMEGGAESIRLTDAELRAHAKWWGLPEGHVPMRGLLGVRMATRNGKTNGVILVTDKERGEFTEEDETLLKQLATVATLALQHVEARMSLEESDRRKNQFLAMLSHELRNPLAPIRNSLYIIDRSKPGSDHARRALSVIDRQAGHLTRLVDDLLDVTRISRGKIRLQRERLDLCDLVKRAVEDYRDAFAQNQLALELSLPEGVLWVNADRTRITQVIGNLLSNSGKFTPAGGKASVLVEVSESSPQAVIRVCDTGLGIASEMLPRVFEAFSQADTSLDRSRGGLGLGLAMVKGLVELHGGSATVQSAGLGEGTEFTVRLPLDVGEFEAEPPVAMRVIDRGPRRVLVIEDNVDAAESLREVLELDAHTVEVAFSGSEGIEKARGFGPDVVLCDIGLPGMDGYEVARAIRRSPELRETRLVALTGYAAPEDIARAREAGFDAHLAKPPSPEKLEEVLAVRARGGQGGVALQP